MADGGVSFRLYNIHDLLLPNYRLATVQEVQDNRDALFKAMPGWEIANLADGSVEGKLYGGHVRSDIRDDVSHKLAISDPVIFKLFNINDPLPADYHLATVQEVQTHRPALLKAMPQWEMANLADGSVDGAQYGGVTRTTIRDDVSHKLAKLGIKPGPLSFKLFNIGDTLPYQYRLATAAEVDSHKEALFQAMPGWEIANLADGSVDGKAYGGHTRPEQRNDVSQKLAILM